MRPIRPVRSVDAVGRMAGELINRAPRHANGFPGDCFDILLRLAWVVDPRLVKIKGTLCNALVAVPGSVHAGVAAVEELKHVVLRLVVLPRIPAQSFGFRV